MKNLCGCSCGCKNQCKSETIFGKLHKISEGKNPIKNKICQDCTKGKHFKLKVSRSNESTFPNSDNEDPRKKMWETKNINEEIKERLQRKNEEYERKRKETEERRKYEEEYSRSENEKHRTFEKERMRSEEEKRRRSEDEKRRRYVDEKRRRYEDEKHRTSEKDRRGFEDEKHSEEKFSNDTAPDNELTKSFLILGLDSTASDAKVKKVYKHLVKRIHPDKLPDDASDEERTIVTGHSAKISSAYNTIKEKRGFS